MANWSAINEGTINSGALGPSVTVTSPSGGATYAPGAAVAFACTASDPTDGPLTGASVEWYSNLVSSGATPFATGESVSYSALPFGLHTITCRVHNSASVTAAASFSLYIDTLPGCSIASPANGASFVSGTSINFVGTGSDADSGSGDTVTVAFTSDLDGALGSGASGSTIAHALTTVGTHVITCTPTDSLGKDGTPSTISLTVTAPPVPSIAITGPVASGASVTVPTSSVVHLTCNATDPVDGVPLVQWFSSAVGGGATVLGTGLALDYSTLPVGSQTITAKATNSLNASVQDQITVVVANADALAYDLLIQCTQTGKKIAPSFTVRLKRSGATWAQPGVPVALTITSGAGVLSGTTTVATDTAGVATFDNVTITGAGRDTVHANAAALSLSADEYVTIRPAAHSFNGARNNTGTGPASPMNPAATTDWYWLDPVHNRRIYYRFWWPTSALAPSVGGTAENPNGTPLLGFWGGVGSEDDGGRDLYSYCQQDCQPVSLNGVEHAQFAADGHACAAIYVQRPGADSVGAYTASTRRATANVMLQLVDDGWNIDTRRFYMGGYSTGGIQMTGFVCEFPNLLAAAVYLDRDNCFSYSFYNGVSVSNLALRTYTTVGDARDWGPFRTGAFLDPTLWDDGSNGDPNFFGEVARILTASGTALLWLNGTDPSQYQPQHLTQHGAITSDYAPVRYRQLNTAGPLRSRLAAGGLATAKVIATGTLSGPTNGTLVVPPLDPSIKYYEVLFNDSGGTPWPDGSAYETVATKPGLAGYDHNTMLRCFYYTSVGIGTLQPSPNAWLWMLAQQRSAPGSLAPLSSRVLQSRCFD